MTGESFPNNVALQCLESMKAEFNQTYEGSDLNSVPDYGLNDEFQEKLKTKFDYYNEYKFHEAEKMNKLKDELYNEYFSNRKTELLNMDKKAEILVHDSNIYHNAVKNPIPNPQSPHYFYSIE